jgi:hypothetical protein
MYKHRHGSTYSLLVLLSLLIFSLNSRAQSQTENKLVLSANADIYSSYIWRGLDMGHKPVFQPGLSATYRNFTLGYYGSYRISGEGDNEINLYLGKSIGPVTFELWDYWSWSKSNFGGFTDFNMETTGHLIEGLVTISGGEKLPLSLTGGWLFYGADPTRSIYLELQYILPVNNSQIMFNAGYQAKGSYYAEKPGFVNLGITYTQPLAVSEKLTLDLLLSLIANPSAKNIFFTVGISLYNN